MILKDSKLRRDHSSNKCLYLKSLGMLMQIQELRKSQEITNCLKIADKILEKHPDHTFTISQKAINLSTANRSDEAYKLINQHLMKNLADPHLWNLDEARKAYLRARQYFPVDEDGLKGCTEELSNLYLLQKNYNSYIDIRKENRQYSEALGVLQSLERNLKGTKEKIKPHHTSEMTLFEAQILEDNEQLQTAIKLLNMPGRVIDQVKLLEINPANLRYLLDLLQLYGFQGISFDSSFTQEQQDKIIELVEKYGKSSNKHLILLKATTGQNFENSFKNYADYLLNKNSPAFLNQLKGLYNSKTNHQEKTTAISNQLNSRLADATEEQQQWIHAYLAQHYAYLDNVENSNKSANEALKHERDDADLYFVISKAFGLLKNIEMQRQLAEKARNLDKSDRYFSTYSTKCQLRLGNIDEAYEIMIPFSKNTYTGEFNSFQLESLWYEIELGNAYLKKQNYVMALKIFNYVIKHFNKYDTDLAAVYQYNFGYFNLITFLQVVEQFNLLWKNKYAVKAAKGILSCLQQLQATKQQEIERVGQLDIEFKNSNDYKKLKIEEKKKNEDDQFDFDTDIHGYTLYVKFLKGEHAQFKEFLEKVTQQNLDDNELQNLCQLHAETNQVSKLQVSN
ncbi:n-alpha-acetyltransferase auxiliary subunit-like [Stylonychia lemnae]|uniref:N-alpha-acetyltransferase auxiliary subunit-like n=1 Tax=Stylonychia lemnae TaxID=5949 RepID=A0A078B1H8_STYLE|nr:n-alpha-acetyltransferase auxiliary subunit-like [Stylonychia lemnae]|eukprot:CDW87098.1 n-alpha-acetyltransferase auxiliary subunit-like [Stylonychia lemnae]